MRPLDRLILPTGVVARTRGISALATICVGLGSTVSYAHHGGEFRRDQEITYEAVVREFRLVNPHSYIVVEETRDDGTVIERVVTLGSANGYVRSGRLERNSIQPGDRLTITGAPAISGVNSTAISLLRDDGTVLMGRPTRGRGSLGGGAPRGGGMGIPSDSGRGDVGAAERNGSEQQQPPASPVLVMEKLSADGLWSSRGANFLATAPDNGLRPAALEQRQNIDLMNDDPLLNCGIAGLPRRITMGGNIAFSWQGDILTMSYGKHIAKRTVHMNRSVALPGAARTPFGFSIGYWEVDTLVVETTHLDDRIQDLVGTPKSEVMKLTERYRFDTPDNPDHLLLELTVDDSEVFLDPYLWNFTYEFNPGWEFLDFPCEPVPRGNSA